MTRIAIIGGGFSGAVTAVQLSRSAKRPVAIDIVEPRARLGAGVAYDAADPAHRINVPASRMTVFPEDTAQFDTWLRARGTLQNDPAALWQDRDAFPQRAVFGRYVAELVETAARDRPDVPITHHRTIACDIAAHPRGFTVLLGTGERLAADILILAVSHPPPAVPAALRAVLADGAPVVADPWRDGALDMILPDARVLIVGTGLTMADVAASLEQRGHRGPMTVMSRRGLLSRGHSFAASPPWTFFKTAPPPATALGLGRAVRRQVHLAQRQGIPWQAVFDDVRANAFRLWNALPTGEQRRLVRHLRPFWDVHRFRVSPQAEAAIGRLRDAGQFHAIAASLAAATWDGASIGVQVRERHSRACRVLHVDAVVVTTGPAHGSVLTSNPALAALARQSLVQEDGVGLGVLVDADSRPIGTIGKPRDDLFIAGPLARGRFGELMGLPQVSDHAAAVGRAVAEVVK